VGSSDLDGWSIVLNLHVHFLGQKQTFAARQRMRARTAPATLVTVPGNFTKQTFVLSYPATSAHIGGR